MSRYVARISCVLSFLIAISACLWSTPSHAVGEVYYKIVGTGIMVTPAGTSAYNPHDITCPLRAVSASMDGYKAAVAAAKAAGDKDGALFAMSPDGKEKIYFDALPDCQAFYRELAGVANPEKPSETIECSVFEPGQAREACKTRATATTKAADDLGGVGAVLMNITSKDLPREVNQKISDDKKKKTEEERACFEGTLDRIGQYWTKQRGVKCVKVAKRLITKNIKKQITDELKHMEKKQATNLKSDGQGSSPGAIISMPSMVGVVQGAVTAIKYAIAVAKVAANNAADLDFLLNECLQLSDKLSSMQTWKKGVLTGLCKQVESLVERQLTQCIRVNVTLDLSLPQFSMALQCPININLNASLSAQGAKFDFSCVKSNPVQMSASWGGQSLLGRSGGLETLFNGNCFKSNTTSPTGTTVGGPVPGIDCGTVSSAPVRSERLQGQNFLAAGTAVANGWVAGQSETILSPSGVSQQITRCDFYRASTRERTNYVYGSGASCNAGTSGFSDGGFETNTACYSGGYDPVTNGDSIPDACLYPVDCLDTGYNFDEARRGVGNCTANIQAQLDVNRSYPIILSTGGVSGGNTEWRSCSDFSSDAGQAPVCCDPQKQDCREARSKNIPICLCDEGDSTNTYIDPVTNQPFPGNKCDPLKGGGFKTCCTPSLNGGIDGCTTEVGMAASEVCSTGDQCTPSGAPAGTDGNGNPITAGQANTAKPSPYTYLEVRPDVTLTDITNTDGSAKQCCSTPWCNICPQHYANAFGMSMKREAWNQTRPGAAAPLSQVRTYNNAILGKGWPFTTTTTVDGETNYTIGINPITLSITNAVTVPGALGIGTSTREDEQDLQVQYPKLHMSDKMELKPSSAMMTSCNDIGPWKIGYTAGDNFGTSNSNALGYVYDSYSDWPRNRKDVWKVFAPLPEPRETPLDYIIRTNASRVGDNGQPVDPIELCSEVIKICAPGTTPLTGGNNGGVGGGGGTGGGGGAGGGGGGSGGRASGSVLDPSGALNAAPSGNMIPMRTVTPSAPAAVLAPAARSTAPAATGGGAVAVPSVTTGSSSGSLF